MNVSNRNSSRIYLESNLCLFAVCWILIIVSLKILFLDLYKNLMKIFKFFFFLGEFFNNGMKSEKICFVVLSKVFVAYYKFNHVTSLKLGTGNKKGRHLMTFPKT